MKIDNRGEIKVDKELYSKVIKDLNDLIKEPRFKNICVTWLDYDDDSNVPYPSDITYVNITEEQIKKTIELLNHFANSDSLMLEKKKQSTLKW